jgi:hypothetical protein
LQLPDVEEVRDVEEEKVNGVVESLVWLNIINSCQKDHHIEQRHLILFLIKKTLFLRLVVDPYHSHPN